MIRALFIFFIAFPVMASEPDELTVMSAKLPDYSDRAAVNVDMYFLIVTLKANEILDEIKEIGLRVTVAPSQMDHQNGFQLAPVTNPFPDIQAAAEYAFAKAYYDISFSDVKNGGPGL